MKNENYWQLISILLVLAVALLFLMPGTILLWNYRSHFQTEEVAQTTLKTATQTPSEIVESTLIEKGAFELVKANCTSCHSDKLITQNRATKAGWQGTIQWMQETQGLWDLGENEPAILNYLATYYAPEQTGRRANLENIEWYELD